MAGKQTLVFHGTIVHSLSREEPFVICEDTLLIVKGGKIQSVRHGVTKEEAESVCDGLPGVTLCRLRDTEFLMPGMVDTHIHAPQYKTAGTGYDMTLLDWLKTYTYPAEMNFSDVDFAREVYTKVVKRTLRNGTTTASYFATIHVEASLILADIMSRYGQRGFVGKVCMDRESPENYVETTAQSLQDTRRFIDEMRSRYGDDGLVSACVTPRFVICCSDELLAGLGRLSKEYDLPIQTHISENKQEIEYVLQNNDVSIYAELYERAGLLTNRTILAHCIYSGEEELDIIHRHSSGIAHCPNSNMTIRSGLMDLRKVMKRGVKVGLGTDLSGGYSSSVQDSMRKAIETSKILKIGKDCNYENIDHTNGFYLATLGGAQVMNLESKIGNFEEGKEFDALVIDIDSAESPVDIFSKDSKSDLIQKFIFCGDDRNIRRIFVRGRLIELVV